MIESPTWPSFTSPLRRGGPPCPPAQGTQTDIGHRIVLMLHGYLTTIRRGRPLCLPVWRYAIGMRGQAWKPAPTGHFSFFESPSGIRESGFDAKSSA